MKQFEAAMRMALNAAEKFVGATAPAPPLGVIALDKSGKVLLGAANQNAEQTATHKILDLAQKLGKLSNIHSLVFTLEPNLEQDRVLSAILKHKNIRQIIIGCKEPNKNVGFVEKLKSAKVEVIEDVLEKECQFFIRAYAKKSATGRPYVTIKSVLDQNGAPLPSAGPKSLTSKPALILAHELRKRSDAIWTGSGTVLTEDPEFTVRWVPDHPNKKRVLMLSDRRKRVSADWLTRAKKNNFITHWADSLESGLETLGKLNILEVIVEAGPLLRDAWLTSKLWDEHVEISENNDDAVKIHFREDE